MAQPLGTQVRPRPRVETTDRRGAILTGVPMAVVYLITALYCLSSILALLWTIQTSLKSDRDLFGRGPWAFPATLHFENFADAWSRAHIATYFFNSFYLSVVATGV